MTACYSRSSPTSSKRIRACEGCVRIYAEKIAAGHQHHRGLLARYSDVIGVGTASNRENTHFTVTVDHAVVGCTNGAVIVVHDVPVGLLEEDDINAYRPENDSRIEYRETHHGTDCKANDTTRAKTPPCKPVASRLQGGASQARART